MTDTLQPTASLTFSNRLHVDYFNTSRTRRNYVEYGTWSVTDSGEYTCTSDAASDRILIKPFKTWTDYTVEADVKLVDETRAGVIFNAEDGLNYLLFALNGSASPQVVDTAAFYKCVNGVLSQIGDAVDVSGYAWTRSQYLNVKASSVGGVLSGFVEGVLVCSESDTTFTWGGVGLAACECPGVLFDNLRAYRVSQVHDSRDSSVIDLTLNESDDLRSNTLSCTLTSEVFNPIEFHVTQVELQLSGMESASEWSESGDGGTPFLDSDYFKEGEYGLTTALTYSGGSCTLSNEEDNGNVEFIVNAGGSANATTGYVGFWCRIGDVDELESSDAVVCRLGSSSSDYEAFSFDDGSWSSDDEWVYCRKALEDEDASGGTCDWTGLDYAAFIVGLQAGWSAGNEVTFDDLRLYKDLTLTYRVSAQDGLRSVKLYEWDNGTLTVKDSSTGLTEGAVWFERTVTGLKPIFPDSSTAYKVIAVDTQGRTYVRWHPRPPPGELDHPNPIECGQEVTAEVGYEGDDVQEVYNDDGTPESAGSLTTANSLVRKMLWLDNTQDITSARLKFMALEVNTAGDLDFRVNNGSWHVDQVTSDDVGSAYSWITWTVPKEELVDGFNTFDIRDPDGTVTDYFSIAYDTDTTGEYLSAYSTSYTRVDSAELMMRLIVTRSRQPVEFKGIVDETVPSLTPSGFVTTLAASDYSNLTKSYSVSMRVDKGTTASDAVKSIINGVEDCPIGVGVVDDLDVTLDEMVFNYTTMNQALDELASLCNAKWTVTDSGNIDFKKSLYASIPDGKSLRGIKPSSTRKVRLRATLRANDEETSSPVIENWTLYGNNTTGSNFFNQQTGSQFNSNTLVNCLVNGDGAVELVYSFDEWGLVEQGDSSEDSNINPSVVYYNDGAGNEGWVRAFSYQHTAQYNDGSSEHNPRIKVEVLENVAGELPSMYEFITKKYIRDGVDDDIRCYNPSIVPCNTVDLFLCWEQYNRDANTLNVYINAYDKSAGMVKYADESEVAITSTDDCTDPSCCTYDDSGTEKLMVVYCRPDGLYWMTSDGSDFGGSVSWGASTKITGTDGKSLQPSIVEDAKGRVWLFYSQEAANSSNVYYSHSDDNGSTWNTVAEVPGINGPKYDCYPSACLVASSKEVFLTWASDRVVEEEEDVYSYEIYSTYTSDSGVSWNPPQHLGGVERGSFSYSTGRGRKTGYGWTSATPGEVDAGGRVAVNAYTRGVAGRVQADYAIRTGKPRVKSSKTTVTTSNIIDHMPSVASSTDGQFLVCWASNFKNKIINDKDKGPTFNLCHVKSRHATDGTMTTELILPATLTSWDSIDYTASYPDVERYLKLDEYITGNLVESGWSASPVSLTTLPDSAGTSPFSFRGQHSILVDGGLCESLTLTLPDSKLTPNQRSLDLSTATGSFDCEDSDLNGKFGVWYYPMENADALDGIEFLDSDGNSLGDEFSVSGADFIAGQWNRVSFNIHDGSSQAFSDYGDVAAIRFNNSPSGSKKIVDDFEWTLSLTQTTEDSDSVPIYDKDHYVMQEVTLDADTCTIDKIVVKAKKVGSPPGGLRCRVVTDESPDVLSGDALIPAASISDSSFTEIEFTVGSFVNASNNAYVYFFLDGVGDASNYYLLRYNSAGGLADGAYYPNGVVSSGEDIYIKTYSCSTSDFTTGRGRIDCVNCTMTHSTNSPDSKHSLALGYDFNESIVLQPFNLEPANQWNALGSVTAGDATSQSRETTYTSDAGSSLRVDVDVSGGDEYSQVSVSYPFDRKFIGYLNVPRTHFTFDLYISDDSHLANSASSPYGCLEVSLYLTEAYDDFPPYDIYTWSIPKEGLHVGWNKITLSPEDSSRNTSGANMSQSSFRTTRLSDVEVRYLKVVLRNENSTGTFFYTIDNFTLHPPGNAVGIQTGSLSSTCLDLSSGGWLMRFDVNCNATSNSSPEVYVGLGTKGRFVYEWKKANTTSRGLNQLSSEWLSFYVTIDDYTYTNLTQAVGNVVILLTFGETTQESSGVVYLHDLRFVQDDRYYICKPYFSQDEGTTTQHIEVDLIDEDGNILDAAPYTHPGKDLRVGDNVLNLQVRQRIGVGANKITVYGTDETVHATASNETSILKYGTYLATAFKDTLLSNYAASQLAKYLLSIQRILSFEGTASVIGSPAYKAGNLINVTGLQSVTKKLNIIRSLTRRFDAGGYTCQLDLNREK